MPFPPCNPYLFSQNVEIKNFSSSWNDGMAFAALIHHFRPVFDYKRLNPKCRRGNFKLAFDVAEYVALEDDAFSILTLVPSYFRLSSSFTFFTLFIGYITPDLSFIYIIYIIYLYLSFIIYLWHIFCLIGVNKCAAINVQQSIYHFNLSL